MYMNQLLKQPSISWSLVLIVSLARKAHISFLDYHWPSVKLQSTAADRFLQVSQETFVYNNSLCVCDVCTTMSTTCCDLELDLSIGEKIEERCPTRSHGYFELEFFSHTTRKLPIVPSKKPIRIKCKVVKRCSLPIRLKLWECFFPL